MEVNFKLENWSKLRPVILPLWERHNAEVASPADQALFDPDWDRFDALAEAKQDHWVSAWNVDQLVGYAFAIVVTHLHRKRTLSAFYDLYYLIPEARTGWNGLHLLRFFEQSLWDRGVLKQYSATKSWLDRGVVFERLGWTKAETLYTKVRQ